MSNYISANRSTFSSFIAQQKAQERTEALETLKECGENGDVNSDAVIDASCVLGGWDKGTADRMKKDRDHRYWKTNVEPLEKAKSALMKAEAKRDSYVKGLEFYTKLLNDALENENTPKYMIEDHKDSVVENEFHLELATQEYNEALAEYQAVENRLK